MSDSEHIENGKDELINGITHDAGAEAEALISGAKQYVAERLAACETRLAEIRKEAEDMLAKQSDEIRRSVQSSAAVEKRRLALRIREKIISEIMSRVKQQLAALITGPGYAETLAGWILEAAIGLNSREATVNASLKEREFINGKMLSEVEKKTAELTSRKVKLQLVGGEPLRHQGVVLTSMDGRTAFNNQVQTRLLRYQSEIRKMIYDTLFKD